MVTQTINGFRNLRSKGSRSEVADDQLKDALNLWWDGRKLRLRNGSKLRKNNSQWSNLRHIVRGIQFKKVSDSFYYEVVVLDNGQMFYITNTGYGSPSSTYTEINSITGSGNALASGLTPGQVRMVNLNDKLYVIDGSGNIYVWDALTNQLTRVQDPTGFSFTFTIADGVDASINDVYEDDDDTSRQFTVTLAKVNGDGTTTLTVRQTAGQTRPTTGGSDNLSKVSGSGDANIAYTGVTFSETYADLDVYSSRLVALGSEGRIYLSFPLDGTTMTGAGTGNFNYDRFRGLKAAGVYPFNQGALISMQSELMKEYRLNLLTGYKFFDASVAGSEVGQFKVETILSTPGIVGDSAQAIAGSMIALSQDGFFSLESALRTGEFGQGDNDFISEDIEDKILQINLSESDRIISAVDLNNKVYFCAVPFGGVTTSVNVIFAYFYTESRKATANTPANHKWMPIAYSYNDIKAMWTLEGKIYFSDEQGTIIETDVNSTYNDNDSAYSAYIETKEFGGEDISVTKTFRDNVVTWQSNVALSPGASTSVNVDHIVDGKVLNKQSNRLLTIPPVKVKSVESDITWDAGSPLWDSVSPFWDAGILRTYRSTISRKYIGVGKALRFSTTEKDVFWGIESLSYTYDENSKTKELVT